jgi:hypothetical protein
LTVKLMKIIGVATILTASALLAGNALAEGRGSGPVVYVESQGLFYDSIVLADLPPRQWR